MDTFVLDLQLFADGGESVETMEQPTEDSSYEVPDFALDENGEPVFFNEGAFGDDGNAEGEETGESVQPGPNEPETYVVKVNGEEQEVSLDELLHGYMRNQDYTRKTQALAEERRNLQSYQPPVEQAQPYVPQQVQPEPTPEPQQPQFTQRDYYEQLNNYARNEVEQIFGEPFDEFNALHQSALVDSITNVKAQVLQAQQAQREQALVEENFNRSLDKYRQDPNFREIDDLAARKLQELPYAQAIQIQEAMKNHNIEIIDQYMAAVRNEYYGSQNVPQIYRKQPSVPQQRGPKPPYVEPAGASTKPVGNPTREIDYSKLHTLSLDDQVKVLEQLNYFQK